MLELALSAGVMVACLSGVFQFGYTFYVYNQLVTAVGNGARYASVRTYRSNPEAAKAAVRNMVVYSQAKPGAGAIPIAKELRPENIEVEWTQDATGTPQTVRVSIQNYRIDAMFGMFEFSGRPSVEFPFIGRYAPSEPEL